MIMTLNPLVGAGLFLLIISLSQFYSFPRGLAGLNLPPGPPPHPFLGNALQLPKSQPWLRITEWNKVYGDIIFMRVLQRPFIVLSSREAIENLLEKKSSVYSLRPLRNMAQLCGFGKALLFQSHADTVRRSRKLMHGELNLRGVFKHQSLLQIEARRMALRAIYESTVPLENLRLTVAASLLRITYGYAIDNAHDPLLGMAEKVMNNLADVITPNKYLVDAMPALKYLPDWFPGCGFKKKSEACRQLLERFMDLPFAQVLDNIAAGTALPSFTSKLLESKLDAISENELDLLKWTAGGIYAAGSDTTISVLSSFFLASLLHPEVQRKAQDEIDRVVGPDALPSFMDRDRLPYVEAVIQEVLRWNPAAPLISRGMTQTDEYKGYCIPAESVVMVNVWALMHDESVYVNPSQFNPDRFLSDASNLRRLPNPQEFVFGFGRRSCPGSHLADAIIYIIVATTLAIFRIEPELDTNGNEIIPEVNYSTGAVSHPSPFKCRMVPRSQRTVKLAMDAAEEH